jgi:hypothetical protein
MKRMLILAVTLWLGVSATAHAQVSSQVNSPTNAVSTVTGAIVPSGQGMTGATGGSFTSYRSEHGPALLRSSACSWLYQDTQTERLQHEGSCRDGMAAD